MNRIDWEKIREEAKEKETKHVKEILWTRRVIKLLMIFFILSILILAIWFYLKIDRAMKPVDADNQNQIEVTIPIGSTTDDIAQVLQEQKLIDNAKFFSLYMKLKGVDDFQAGYYDLSPSMSADEILVALEAGGEPIQEDIDTTLTIVEGMQLSEIAEMVAESTPIEADEFMEKADNKDFISEMTEKFPSLLSPLAEIEGLKHPLEGYLYPATYDYMAGMSVDELLEKMIGKSNIEYQKLKEDLNNTEFSYHEILTLASIIEREGVTDEDRSMISGVFLNRIYAEMPLQSDITVIYALGEHKELVTYEDTEVDSPYNTYMNTGLPPGPINTPSMSSITAAIYPTYSEYYYFVADMNTGEVYYSSTIEEHDALVEEYVQPFFDEASQEAEGEDEQLNQPANQPAELPEEEAEAVE
ncbi:endolytic transglycosylase MltG [Facklamia sp. DSM 111018]|uniref:Endolytic murein transglycosylase n=1 Tax=Facklamia lactis TaxID=2749967 RepID=A0ABS0LNB5_9LACT|nr:endolytic transglycosylase MltG [Facklamia lactis]MBG9979701.1 endolytic transglycosylase MltG [Facklamia lactis]MBG9985619.1 endolytic transglycosylase MltG [Facklamia lactis]